MAQQINQLKLDPRKSDKENLQLVVKFMNSLVDMLNYTLNNMDLADVTTEGGVSLQDLYAMGALRGEPGEPGQPGQPGKNGIGVPAGGITGQVLAKKSDDDYDTEWIDLPTV